MRTFLLKSLNIFGVNNLPIKVRGGINRGMVWTLFPWTSYWRGNHEPTLQEAILQTGNLTGKCCWDLGAHYGFYSVAFAHLAGISGRVYAFEPSESAFLKLKTHKSLNSLEQLTIFKAAVSDTSGEKELIRYDSAESTTSHFAFTDESTKKAPFRSMVTTYALDELVEKGTISPADIIKIDVEGHGHKALLGAINSIRRSRPIIFMGVHCIEEKQAVEKLLKEDGYELKDEAGTVLQEVPLFGDIILKPTDPTPN